MLPSCRGSPGSRTCRQIKDQLPARHRSLAYTGGPASSSEIMQLPVLARAPQADLNFAPNSRTRVDAKNIIMWRYYNTGKVYVLQSGCKLISELLLLTSSVMDTLPLCLMNLATAFSSSTEMWMNFPRSSTTPVISPDSCRDCTRDMASCGQTTGQTQDSGWMSLASLNLCPHVEVRGKVFKVHNFLSLQTGEGSVSSIE